MKARVRLCMATSLDGRISERPGAAPAFTSRYDRNKLFRLRSESDVLLIGASTVRSEKLPPLIRDPELAKQRAAKGLPPHPAAAILSRSLDLPWESDYFTKAEQAIFVITGGHEQPPSLPPAAQKAGVRLLDVGSPFSLQKGVEMLAAEGFANILAEGGGRLNHSLLADDLIDLAYLTIAPVWIGSQGSPALCEGPVLQPASRFTLVESEIVEQELHLVYRRRLAGESDPSKKQ